MTLVRSNRTRTIRSRWPPSLPRRTQRWKSEIGRKRFVIVAEPPPKPSAGGRAGGGRRQATTMMQGAIAAPAPIVLDALISVSFRSRAAPSRPFAATVAEGDESPMRVAATRAAGGGSAGSRGRSRRPRGRPPVQNPATSSCCSSSRSTISLISGLAATASVTCCSNASAASSSSEASTAIPIIPSSRRSSASAGLRVRHRGGVVGDGGPEAGSGQAALAAGGVEDPEDPGRTLVGDVLEAELLDHRLVGGEAGDRDRARVGDVGDQRSERDHRLDPARLGDVEDGVAEGPPAGARLGSADHQQVALGVVGTGRRRSGCRATRRPASCRPRSRSPGGWPGSRRTPRGRSGRRARSRARRRSRRGRCSAALAASFQPENEATSTGERSSGGSRSQTIGSIRFTVAPPDRRSDGRAAGQVRPARSCMIGRIDEASRQSRSRSDPRGDRGVATGPTPRGPLRGGTQGSPAGEERLSLPEPRAPRPDRLDPGARSSASRSARRPFRARGRDRGPRQGRALPRQALGRGDGAAADRAGLVRPGRVPPVRLPLDRGARTASSST